jgi:hypothetical protein
MYEHHLVDVANLHALLEAVRNGPLAGRRRLCESDRATKGTRGRTVADTSDAHVADARNRSVAGHAGRHLDLHVELCAGGERDTLDAEAGDILGDFGALEGGLGGPARGTIDISGEGACAVLVDLGTC